MNSRNTLCCLLFYLTPQLATVAADPLSGDALFSDVVTYHGLGEHRTATTADHRTSEWLAEELENAGYDVRRDEWTLRQFFLEAAELTVTGTAVDCFPFWFPTATDGELTAPMAEYVPGRSLASLKNHIAFMVAPSGEWRFGIADLAERLAGAGALGVVVAVPHPSGEVMAQNAVAPYNQRPLPIPALIIADKDRAFVTKSADMKLEATISIRGRDDPDARASNVAATLRRGEPWFVVTTPSSGWFRSAGERGPGIALFLALARWAAQHETHASWLFLANSGHELDQIGAHHTLDWLAPPPGSVVCWIHLGASIAVREWERTATGWTPLDTPYAGGNLVGTQSLVPVLNETFADVPFLTPRTGEPVHGELKHFIDAGYTAFGFFGGHTFFHTRLDTPRTTAPEFLEPVARALIKTITRLDAIAADDD